jgi:GDP/GTP exchange factor Sec2p
VVTDAFASKHSPTTIAEKGIWKYEPETNLRRCSSSSIHTPVTPKPSQVHVTPNKSDIRFTDPAGDLTYGNLYTSETATTNTVRELQRSLKESKDYTISLETKLKQQTITQQTLKQELFELNEKYTSELARADNIGHEKSKIELELEDLTATLFEQANEMVAHEKRISQALETDNWRLCKDLSAALSRLAEESMQLTELKDKFSKQDTYWKQLQPPYPASPAMTCRSGLELKSNDNEISRSR